jgi:hypothetical protein
MKYVIGYKGLCENLQFLKMFLIKRLKVDKVLVREITIGSLELLITLGLFLALPDAFNKATIPEYKQTEFKLVKFYYPEILDIFKINNIALIKDISPSLQGLAEIELQPNTILTDAAMRKL